MRVNVFSIPNDQVSNLKSKLRIARMDVIKQVDQDGWRGLFFYSSSPAPGEITWAETYKSYFTEDTLPKNINYYAVYVFEKDSRCFAVSYGKSHFYVRPFCDHDFGIEVAKRIANESDIKQTASRKFQGKRKKDIKSYAANTRLDVESGESVDYLQAGIIEGKLADFGKSGKFGASALMSPDITPSDLGAFLSKLERIVGEESRFKLPRTTIIDERSEVDRYDQLLVNELLKPIGTTEFTENSYDLYGVDFVFSNIGSFKIKCAKYDEVTLDELSVKDLKDYIEKNKLPREDILGIRIVHEQEGHPRFTQPIREALDFIVDDDRVILSGGKWMRFNQDYLEFLDEYLRDIKSEQPEAEFTDIWDTETVFNNSDAISKAGYEIADKDFSIFKTRAKTPIEAWDLKKDNRVYAVKFGTPQRLNYVVDQANIIIELLGNRANVKKLPEFNEYCLWLGYRGQKPLANIADSGSIILKQKVEAWAHRCRDLGIEPMIKISRSLKRGVDSETSA